jgi:hypothetical protein
MASHYTSSMTSRLGGSVPGQLLGAVRNNVGQAIGIAHQSSTPAGLSAQIARAARASFVSGLHIIGLAGAAVTLLAAIGVVLFLPARARDSEQPAPTPSADAPAPVAVGLSS